MELQDYFDQIVRPEEDSRKGENGRVLVIGGSKLFHAASFWAAAMASKIVDMVHFSSPAMENNDLMRVRAKAKFWDGIVVPWESVEHYIAEDDAILIGPGMPRDDGLMAGEKATGQIVNDWLRRYPDKRWVVDGGALQEVDVNLLNSNHVVTPNARELQILTEKAGVSGLTELASKFNGVTMLAKGPVDIATDGVETVEIAGGNAGMTKGGTGDALAGMVTALYAKSPAMASCVTASYVAKKAGEKLYERVGPYFTPQELLEVIPEVLWGELSVGKS